MSGRKPHHGKPEVGDGHVRIANELYSALCRLKAPPNIWQIIHAIIMHTYGHIPSRKMMYYDLKLLSATTGVLRPNISRAIKALISSDIVISSGNGNKRYIGLNKYYKRWQPLSGVITDISTGNAPAKRTFNSLKQKTIGGISKKKTTTQKRSQIQNDAPMTQYFFNYAVKKGIPKNEIRGQWNAFRDHHVSKGSLMADWDAAGRTWVRNYFIMGKGKFKKDETPYPYKEV